MIYWVRAGDVGPVKVGYAASDVAARIRELQAGNPVQLVLLRREEGGRRLEAALHRLYRAKRLAGEWFALSDADVAIDLADVLVVEPSIPRPAVVPLPPVANAIAAAGNAAELARRVGVTRFAVQQWKAAGIPLGKLRQVSAATGLPMQLLRPDFFAPEASA